MNLQNIIKSCIIISKICYSVQKTIAYLHTLFQLRRIIIIASCLGQYFGQGRIIAVASSKQETFSQSSHNADSYIASRWLVIGVPEHHRKVDWNHIPWLRTPSIKNMVCQIFKK